jgi:hypothetical protein
MSVSTILPFSNLPSRVSRWDYDIHIYSSTKSMSNVKAHGVGVSHQDGPYVDPIVTSGYP